MSRNIINDLTTVNFNKGRTQKIQFIVIHYTANDGDTARGNANYFRTTNRGASAHYFVDEKETVRVVKDEDVAWHCGANTYIHSTCRNSNSIGIEMCSRKYANGTYYFKQEVIDATVELTQILMKQYNIPIENVIRHKDVTGKICPAPYSDNNEWNKFKNLVKQTAVPTPTQPVKNNDETIWNFLKSKALNDFAIAGIMGNLFAESGLIPNNVQGSWKQTNASQYNADYTAKVDNGQIDFVNDKTGGGGYGLAQWTYYTRKQGLLDFAKSSKTSIGDLTMQLNYLWKELQGYTSMMNTLKNATSILQASNAVLFDFERPADQGATVQTTRANYGQGYYDKFAKTITPTKTSEEIAVENAVNDGIIASPDHWLSVLTGKQPANPEYVRIIFEKYNTALTTKKTIEEIAIEGAVTNGIINSPDYWLEVLRGKQQPNPEWLRTVFENYHAKLVK